MKARKPKLRHKWNEVLDANKAELEIGICTENYWQFPPISFVSKGREINKLSDMASFQSFCKEWKKRNPQKDCVWNTPQVPNKHPRFFSFSNEHFFFFACLPENHDRINGKNYIIFL